MAHNRRSYSSEYDNNAKYVYYGMDIGHRSKTASRDTAEHLPRPHVLGFDSDAQSSVGRRASKAEPDRAESYRRPYIVGYDYNSHGHFSDPYSQESPTAYVNIDAETVQPDQSEITQDEGSAKKRKKKVRPKIQGLSYIIAKFADITSMNGPPYIVRSKSYLSKVAWTILMIAAFGALGWNLSSIFGKYLEEKKVSKVDIKFSSLPFPAVTICNFNIARLSQINSSTGPLKTLVNDLTPENLKLSVEACNYVTNIDFSSCLHVIFTKIHERAATVPPPDYNYYEYEYQPQYADEGDYYKDTWEAESQESNFDNITKMFKEYFLELNDSTLYDMGHQIEDMLLECSFAGGKCYPENFTHFYSNNYGNCYTLQHEKFISRTSGSSGGLELVLHLETEEYVPYFTTNNGIRVVVHEPNSLPFPDENGLSVMPGTNTFIGIKQVNVTRMPTKYDNCSNDDYNQIYNFAYTLYTCQSICEYNRIRDECNCSSNANREIQNVLKKENDTHCGDKKDCVRTKHFDQDTTQCDCKNPCKETLYQEVISSTKWPTEEYATVFSIPICHVKNLTCGFAGEKLIQEFVKLNIFYQDLNHQVIVEKADYEIYQLFSDIGGTLGLWIGISVLGIFEVVHLIIRVAVFLITGRCAQTKPK